MSKINDYRDRLSLSSSSESHSSSVSPSGSSESSCSSSSGGSESGPIVEATSSPTTSTAPPRKKRGASTCKKLAKGGPRKLTFDKNGIPESPLKHVNEFSSFCGHLARTRVDIRIKDWRKVSKDLKKNLWEDVSAKFVMPKDAKSLNNVKRVTLKSIGHAWRDFKWKLNANYVKKDKTPFEDYPLLNREYWPDFVKWVTCDEYVSMGDKAKKNQSMNKFHQKLGRRSYTVQKVQWAKADALARSEGKPIPFEDMPDGRHKDWARARNPTGDTSISKAHPIINKIVDLNSQSLAGTFTTTEDMDILATAIGSNHPGRTTGVSGYIGLGMGLSQDGVPPKKKRRCTMDAITRLEMEYNIKFEQMKKEMEQMRGRLDGVDSCSSSKGDQLDSAAPQYPVDLIQEVTKCKLVVPVGTTTVMVARGQAFPPKDVQTVHGVERQHDYTRVQVDFVFDNFMEYPLPIPIKDDDKFTLGSVKNSFVLWPKSGMHLDEVPKVLTPPQISPEASPTVVASQPSTQNSDSTTPDPSAQQNKMPSPPMVTTHEDVPSNGSNDKRKKKKHSDKKHKREKKEKQRSSKGKSTDDDDDLDPLWGPPCRRSPSPTPPCRKFVPGQPFQHIAELKKMGSYSQSFHKWYMAMSTTRTSRRQQATHFMVQYGEHDFHTKSGVYLVDFSDVFHLYNDQALVISLLRSWILFMRKQDKYRSLVGFLDPDMVLQKRINEEGAVVASYIVQALLAQQDKECIFAVCQEGCHWVLLAIFPKWNTVYTIDSKANPLGTSYSLKPLFDRAFLTYVEQGRHNDARGGVVSWNRFKAHTQPSSSCMLSGQYVMRHMLSFTEQLTLKPDRYPQGRTGFATSPFLPEEIADVRERLLEFFMMEVVDIGGSCRVDRASYN